MKPPAPGMYSYNEAKCKRTVRSSVRIDFLVRLETSFVAPSVPRRWTNGLSLYSVIDVFTTLYTVFQMMHC